LQKFPKEREKRDYILMFAGGVRGRETTTEATVVKIGAREQSGGDAHEEGDAPKKSKALTRDALSRVFRAP
jgi:hypothetical protein